MLVEMMKINKRETIVVSSRDVAETFGKEHKEVIYSIEGRTSDTERAGGKEVKNKGILHDLIEGGELHLEKYFIPSEYKAENGRAYKEYLMTRDGFTLLVMGFSGEKAMRFKVAYINQFNQMEELLKSKLIEREKGIVIRQAFTKALKESGENERMHNHAYSTYTDLIYREVFGKSAKQLRDEYGISKKENLRDCFSPEELAKVKSVEMVIGGLVDCGWGYDDVKSFITNASRKLIAG